MASTNQKKIASLLLQVKRLAGHASLTGSLEDGKTILIATYNKCLAALQSLSDSGLEEIWDMDIFSELPEDASIDEVGVAAALLASLVTGDEEQIDQRLARLMFADEDEEDEDW